MGSDTQLADTGGVGDANTGTSTYKRTAADEVADTNMFKENLAKAAFEDWPNEAGFEGLTEHRGPVELRVKGNIPTWTAGSLYRTGPGACTVEDTKIGTFHISHWFDGLAHTHRFDILAPEGGSSADNGAVRVVYFSRRQSDTLTKQIKDEGRMLSKSFAQRSDPCIGMFGKFMAMFQRRGQMYTNVGVTVNANMPAFEAINNTNRVKSQGHLAGASNLLIGSDVGLFAQADPQTLEITGYFSQAALHPELKGQMGPAHGMRDSETGDYFSFNLELGVSPTYRVFQVSADTRKTTILARFQSKPAYIHSFFLTKNYVILCIPVAHFQWGGAKIVWEGTILEAIAPFDDAEKCYWFIVDRNHGKGIIAQFMSPATFFFHTTNAFEDDDTGDVVCEVIRYASTHIMQGFYYDVLLQRNNKARKFWCDGSKKSDLIGELVRYRFAESDFDSSQDDQSELPSPEVVLKVTAPHIGDLPTINDAYACRKHRYTYSMACRGLSTLFDGILKVDCETKDVLIWSGPRGHSPSEAIFVPRPSGEKGQLVDEDDGVLLSVVLDGVNKTSYLLCLDAKTMTELGRAECEFAVAITLHGQLVKSTESGL
ncbi:torulene oxygenase [Apiospora phragmitis]|uniref:Torulene oxygenase n=1 Tax=Apiospora phragmitis TaxID=2905665 RepID=A0ABR1SUU2_9PEZI